MSSVELKKALKYTIKEASDLIKSPSDFKTETITILDCGGDAKSAQATLHVLDAQAVLLVGGSIEALKIFTSKPMTEEKPCIFGEKCRVFNKIVNSEI